MEQVETIEECRLRETTGLCARCKRSAPAEVWRVGAEVRLRKRCDEHGAEDVLLSTNGDWYESTEAEGSSLEPPLAATHEVSAGCPFDCGPCTQCCVGMPNADGTSIPSCAYNVLYRERDARFVAEPAPALVTLGAGRRQAERRAS